MFACGAVLGQSAWFSHVVGLRALLFSLFIAAIVLIALGSVLTVRNHLRSGIASSLAAWLLLGTLGASIASEPRSANHILTLIERGQIGLQTPLRWHGYLRDEPAQFPWGYGYEIELTGVEFRGEMLTARGGLRVNFTPQPNQALPDAHAGDGVVAVVEARRPQVFRDPGAFDRRAYLEQQDIHLVATLRGSELLERDGVPRVAAATLLARVRARLRNEVDALFSQNPKAAAVLRAMLLGDRSFVDHAEATNFQKTGVFHVLVVAGLHVGAFTAFLFWAARKLRLAPFWTALTALTLICAYVGVVEERPPVLRAALMAALVLIGHLYFRRLDLLNSAAIAALVLLVAKPLAVRDSSFQLTFLAMGSIAGLALPWLEKTVQPYVRALRGWRDVTRDAAHTPHAAQFRIDLRSAMRWLSGKLPVVAEKPACDGVVRGIAILLRAWELLVITFALQLGMLPLMAGDFHRVTMSAPLVNLVAVPLTGIIVPLGFVALGSALVVPLVGRMLAIPVGWCVVLLVHIVDWFARFPRWSYRIPGPPVWLIVVFFAAGAAMCFALRGIRLGSPWPARIAGIVLAASAAAIATFPFSPSWSRGKLELTVLDVGQGDSLFVVSARGKTMLIDGGGTFGGFSGHEEHNGPDPGEDAVSPYLWSRGFQKVDIVALTHAHQDHIGGLTAVLQNFRVGTLMLGREESSAALATLENLARQERIPIVHETRGTTLAWDGAEARFLWPEPAPDATLAEPNNNDSLVLRLRYGNREFLLPGDAEKQAENAILSENDGATLRADVLKVGHHGSKNSTMPEFLDAVRPSIAIISAGENNPYGHPSPDLLARLQSAGARILRTDRNGAVQILTDGNALETRCYLDCGEKASRTDSARSEPPDREQDPE
jgi:competence protein ComEC